MTDDHEPIIKKALGEGWYQLPEILQRNFDLQPGRDGVIRLRGTMYEIWHSRMARVFIYLARLTGALVPYEGRDIPIEIEMRTRADDPKYMHWRRVHQFPEHPDVVFETRMEYVSDNRIVEKVHLGMGLCMKVSAEGDVLKFRSPCYMWSIFGRRVHIPCWLLLGSGEITERAVGPDSFEMFFEIHHPWFGPTYRYNGIFRIEQAEP
ncbi:MAG: DUF4166 domain-containing protein [Pseudohongiella sp.]|nr:DUF4166 domain-containing protein [Pseudohongiella sp.]MDP2128203.1 DUF4166 domain-containing protein [Pseudohongiella sp.]